MSEPSTTPRGFRAPAARHVQVPSGRELVSSISILRAISLNLQRQQVAVTVPGRYAPGVRTEPVVLVHGFASSFERNWREPGWADLLADAGREGIGLDLLGHGTAAKPHDPAAYADLEASVSAALPHDRIVDAVGFSLGAQLLLAVAAAQPERFGRL